MSVVSSRTSEGGTQDMAYGIYGGNVSLLPQFSPCLHGELGPRWTVLRNLEETLL